jgi:hypothetical protein
MRKILMGVVRHSNQRYETVGDWVRNEDGDLIIKVSDLGDSRMNHCVMIHELVEALLCDARGIPEKSVTEFDLAFEKARPANNFDEPGDSPNAPYRKEHFAATTIERLLAQELGLDWKEYEDAVNSLSQEA